MDTRPLRSPANIYVIPPFGLPETITTGSTTLDAILAAAWVIAVLQLRSQYASAA